MGRNPINGITRLLASSFSLPYLRQVVTSNVTGATVILIGATLVWTTLNNIQRAYINAEAGQEWQVILLSSLVFATIVVVTRLGNPWLKLGSITIGLLVGYVAALMLNLIDFAKLDELDGVFVPHPAKYPLAIDWSVVAMLLPIFIISMMESVGDLTATSSLSGLATRGKDYWRRVRGGVLGDSVNSLMASLFCTFPNTTFSQNNGVIQLTGVCSRYVGFYVAGFLILLGTFPIVGGMFQVMPDAVLHGATLLMFSMVAYAGYRIVLTGSPKTQDWAVVGVSIVGGWMISLVASSLSFVPPAVVTVIEFPVSTGALIAFCLELVRFILRRLGDDGHASD
ncbi:MAG: xanthine/uracil permease [Proteobacteria bacterium]|nr:xanthine/uracil permease [Pseudomonadota bacterium]